MNTPMKFFRDNFTCRFTLFGFFILFISVIFSGCVGNYGKLHWDAQVTTAFQNHDFQQDFNYYYYGVGNRTFAIAGISPDYHMESRMWRDVQEGTPEFKDLVSRAWENYSYKPYEPQGAQILDTESQQVGIWYSSLRFVTVKFADNNRIILMPDTPFLGGPEADAESTDSSKRLSRLGSIPYISYQLKAILARR
jgi:hypothetical protein